MKFRHIIEYDSDDFEKSLEKATKEKNIPDKHYIQDIQYATDGNEYTALIMFGEIP